MASNKNHDEDISNINDQYLHRTNTINSVQLTENPPNQTKPPKKKIIIEVDEDDPCLKQGIEEKLKENDIYPFGNDPRFQQQNQTLRCWVMYTDFYRCEHILGPGSEACSWFKGIFTTMCPKDWVRRFDELKDANKLPWHKYRTQGDFPGDKYGV